jgi:hypothetical protein
MKKVNLNNLYESPYPPTDINTLWVDKDENTGKIKAIHEYNKSKGEWEPSMVSVDYLEESSTDTYTVRFCVPIDYTSADNWDTTGGLKSVLTQFLTSHDMDAATLLTNPNQMKIVDEDVPASVVTPLLYDMHSNTLAGMSVICSCFSVEKNS